ncbi:hypothetical protein HN51_004519, partial [Arachis hypogaea]
ILEYNVIQDFFSRNILLNYISKRQNMAVAKQLLSSMITRGLVSDVYTYETIIARYCKLGNTNDILQKYIVDELQKRRLFDTTSFNTLISGYYTVWFKEEEKELMKMKIAQSICPDFVTYTTLVTHFIKKCSPNGVIALHDYVILKGVVPDQKTYDTIETPLLLEEGRKKKS